MMNTLIKLRILRGSNYKEKVIVRRQLTDHSNCINLPDSYLLKNCGVNKAVFLYLLQILDPVIPKTQRSNGIPFPIKKSVSRIIKSIVEGLNNVLDDFVIFPASVAQREQIKEGFYRKYNFPETIGSLEGTYIEIVCPRDDEEAFYDMKEKYSIHAQIICDASLRITGICCRFGGAASCTYIWNQMNIRQFIENISRQGEISWLIADNKYPQRAWLMTPILNAPQCTPDSQYNDFQARARTCIQSCISKLKARWQCLHKRPLHYTPLRSAKIINACAVLHNLCLKAGLPDPEPYVELQPQPIDVANEMTLLEDNANDLYIGIEMRRQVAERIYYNI